MAHGNAIYRQRVQLQTQVCGNGVAKLKRGTRGLDLQKPTGKIRGLEHGLIHVEGNRLLAKIPANLFHDHVLKVHPHPNAIGSIYLRRIRDVCGCPDDQLTGNSVDFIARNAGQIDYGTRQINGTRLSLECHAVARGQHHF